MSFKNAGGIRDHIGLVVQPPGTTQPADVVFLPSPANPDAGKREGDISQFNVEGVLRFKNGVAIVPLTASRFVEVVEHAVGFDGAGEVTAGRFPQVGGMRFSFDPSAPAGRRVRSLAVVDEGGAVTDRVVEDGMLVGDPEREIRVVTLNFLANGGDGYPFPLPAAGRIDLACEAVQPNAPSPDFPDTNGNGAIDAATAADPGRAGQRAGPPGRVPRALLRRDAVRRGRGGAARGSAHPEPRRARQARHRLRTGQPALTSRVASGSRAPAPAGLIESPGHAARTSIRAIRPGRYPRGAR